MNPTLFWIAGALFAVVVAALAWGYRWLARRAELDAAEDALERELADLERELAGLERDHSPQGGRDTSGGEALLRRMSRR